MKIAPACFELIESLLWLIASEQLDEEIPFDAFTESLLAHGHFYIGPSSGEPRYTDNQQQTYIPLDDGGVLRVDDIKGSVAFGALLYPSEPPEETTTTVGVQSWN